MYGSDGVPDSASSVFGPRVGVAAAYAELLAGPGIERGLLGPREAPRLWDRHILNSAVLAELVEPGLRVADVGSGAGLPGIPLAIARPDLEMVLIEPLLRRSEFLTEAVQRLRLESVTVLRSRAEDVTPSATFDVVAARAVAPMERLAGWTLPLLRPGGLLLAMKGESVSEELRDSAASLARMGATSWRVEVAGTGVVEPVARVAVVTAGRADRVPERGARQRRKNR
ncbi:16S rRNA (guanine(527)-N(7))-methyltransferase RsmG [Jiangella asiatica]|uniref:Ribosomal RNA small subunit methyltransferase G n=1 Tax=Jiangella asiatica TaxID=2530372 RepID=A0A4V6PFQ6_9ACTN|nr:16S rRNA (guanine(527)-N(7))-methyltransferase RsmG [Jiangella asiatica]TDE12608.1 16S rRNA (guanine(527)-N(7))-methyltransferase RsmG [Jiangella asiatica]